MRKLTIEKLPEKHYAYVYNGKPILNANVFLTMDMVERGCEAYEFDNEKEMYQWAADIFKDSRCVHYDYCKSNVKCRICPSAEMGAIC